MKTFAGRVLLWGSMVLACAGPGPAHAQDSPAAVAMAGRGNVEAITAAQLRDYLYFIASDEMEGRDTPSRGLRATANFIATLLSRWGLQPMGDRGTCFQRVPILRTRIDAAATHASLSGERFRYGEDFLASHAAGSVSGPLVYVAQCWTIKSRDVAPDAAANVKNKIIITHAGMPAGVSVYDLKGEAGGDWENPAGYAQRQGARGIIYVPTFQDLVKWEDDRREQVEAGKAWLEAFPSPKLPAVPVITASPRLLHALFQGEAQSAAAIFSRTASARPFDLRASKQISFSVGVVTTSEFTQNVIAAVEGADSRYKKEYVALSAHYDHVGIGRAVAGDSIYNGADDDGSGTVAILAMAEALARGPRPKRSVLFIWHTGEEQGLWGARYLTAFPPVPMTQMIALLNLDMIGRSRKPGDNQPANAELSGPNEVYVIGAGRMSTALGELSEAVNKSYLNLTFNAKYDDPLDPNHFFYRSDHYHYAQKGVPIIFYFDGLHEDYHKPSDSPDKIDYEKMEKVARTIFATAWELAHVHGRPVVNKPLDTSFTAY